MFDHVYKKIDAIVFGLLSPQMIKKMATTKVVTPELYDKEGYPVDGGLMDVRMGVIDPGLRCKSCGGKLKECMGHFGFIEFARPVVHVKYVDVIYDFLRGTCKECGRILADEQRISEHKKELEEIKKEGRHVYIRKFIDGFISSLRTIKKCPYCKAKQGTVKLEKPVTFIEDDRKLTPMEIKVRLERVTDSDVDFLGLNSGHARPDWMVLNLIPVPPVTVRPSITLESGERSEDDLTHKLGDIVRINQRLWENINAGAPEVIVEDLWDLLQYHVITYFDNELPQIPPARHRGGQPLKTLTDRIKSKEGRFRYNLAGKRVNYAARTVISPDPKLKLNEVGIPLSIAMDLTIPEVANKWNLERLKAFINRGPKKYPGANYVIRPNGTKKQITDETKQQLIEELEENFIVERHLMDGDISIFNRQPSLHRVSIMCHKIKVLPGNSFRLNPSVCVAPNTLVQLSTGIQRPIDDLKNCWKESELSTIDRKNNKLFSTELKKFWGLKPEEYGAKCYEITTKETNRKIVATGDHPFYTSSGIKKASDLIANNKVIIRPLDGPIYKEINKIIVSENDIKKVAPKETYIKHSIKTLEELKLLPLNLIDQRTMILSRLLGHLYGDGTFILKKDVARLIFRGTKEDLENIHNDIKSLGFNPEKIYIKTSEGEVHTVKGKTLHIAGSYPCFEVRNKPLALLFAVLGAPNGDKVKLNYTVPKWIQKAPQHIKREFIASYFGCELSAPKIRKNSKSNFRSLVFKISKTKINKEDGYKFIESVNKLLKEFDVEISHISESESNIRKNGEITYSLAANITSNKSMLNLFGKIGYVYDAKKDNVARLAYQYLTLKQKQLLKRKEKYGKFFELRKNGVKFKDISRLLNLSVGTLEHWAYNYKSASLDSGFISFNAWINQNSAGPGLVYETIGAHKEIYCPFVYDITTTADTHNFFANGFLTKNCAPYNADFDGDEMNIHIPQTEEARAEAEMLMQVQSNLITPKNGQNVVGCIEDAIAGNYLLTKEMEFSKEEAVQLLISIGAYEPEKFRKLKNKVSGREVFSVLLPDDFDFIGKSLNGSQVLVKNGNLIEGVIDKATIGESIGSLIRSLFAIYSEDIGIEILGKIFRLGIASLLKRGFTTGISDTDLNENIKAQIEEIISDAEKKAKRYIKQYEDKELAAIHGMTKEETVEVRVMEVLNEARNKVGKLIAKVADENNPTIIMANSGAKGKTLNLAQMAGCVGQQVAHGKRIEHGYRKRVLAIFEENNIEPESRGWIRAGFKHGLKPYEFFMHALTGRDSLMDTALRTPKSGYLYRRLVNALQDLRVEYDGTVRDSNSNIVQFSYGEDGIDVSKSEGGTIDVEKIVKEAVNL